MALYLFSFTNIVHTEEDVPQQRQRATIHDREKWRRRSDGFKGRRRSCSLSFFLPLRLLCCQRAVCGRQQARVHRREKLHHIRRRLGHAGRPCRCAVGCGQRSFLLLHPPLGLEDLLPQRFIVAPQLVRRLPKDTQNGTSRGRVNLISVQTHTSCTRRHTSLARFRAWSTVAVVAAAAALAAATADPDRGVGPTLSSFRRWASSPSCSAARFSSSKMYSRAKGHLSQRYHCKEHESLPSIREQVPLQAAPFVRVTTVDGLSVPKMGMTSRSSLITSFWRLRRRRSSSLWLARFLRGIAGRLGLDQAA